MKFAKLGNNVYEIIDVDKDLSKYDLINIVTKEKSKYKGKDIVVLIDVTLCTVLNQEQIQHVMAYVRNEELNKIIFEQLDKIARYLHSIGEEIKYKSVN